MTTNFPISIFQGVLLGIFVSLAASLFAIRIARRLNLVDIPGSEPHKQHKHPIPMAGGISLLLTLLIGLLLNLRNLESFWKYLIPSVVIFGIGLVDDFRPIRFWPKLGGQLCAALVLIMFGGQVHVIQRSLANWPLLLTKGLDIAITILWLVGIANAYNFVDSMDGLATGLSVIVAVFFSFTSLLSGQILLAHFMSYLVGACLGLYLLNSAPARLFLGNSGTLFLGFLLAETSLLYNPRIFPQLSSWFVPIMVLGLPLFDMALVVGSRLRRGIPIYRADLGHTYHRLVALGLEPGRAVLAMQMASIALGCLAFIAINQTPYVANAIFVGVCLIGFSLLVYLDHPRQRPSS